MKNIVLALLVLFSLNVHAQDIDQLLEQATNSGTTYTSATFKSTRIILGHSIERMPNGQLDFRISHHFGQLNTGFNNLYGLDGPASIHFSLEYGITNWLMVGAGRGNYEKLYDGFLKFSLLRQSSGDRVMPVSVSLLTSAAVDSRLASTFGHPVNFWDRNSYVFQALVARKMSERLSLEINPTIVHRNIVATEVDPNDVFSVGTGMRFKLTTRVSFNVEYYYVYRPLRSYQSLKTYNPISAGFDIETGGHVFQLFFTNSNAMIEKGIITETTGNIRKGGIYFGFNISRVFALKKLKE